MARRLTLTRNVNAGREVGASCVNQRVIVLRCLKFDFWFRRLLGVNRSLLADINRLNLSALFLLAVCSILDAYLLVILLTQVVFKDWADMVALTIDPWLSLNAQRIVIKARNGVTFFISDAYYVCFLTLLLLFTCQSSQILDLGDTTDFKTLLNIGGQLVHIYMFLVQNLSFWGKSELYWLILLYVIAQVKLFATMLFHFFCNSCFFQFISFLYFSPLLFSLGN